MEEAKINMPLLGDDFPELKVQTTHGPMNIPGDLKGKWFVLFSHPADFTPVCTTEFVAFNLGMLHPGKGSNIRAVFIADPKDKVRLIMYYPQEVGRNMDEVVRAVRALQISDKQGAQPDRKQRGDFSKYVPRLEFIGVSRLVAPHVCGRLALTLYSLKQTDKN